VLHSLTGLRVGEFDQLIADLRPIFSAADHERHTRPDRVRSIGGGRHTTLPVLEQVLLTVVWLRLYPTHEVLGFFFGVSHSTISRLLARTVPLLAKAGRDTMRMPDPGRKHRRHMSQLLSELPELAVVVDTWEQGVQRPQGTDDNGKRKADKWYSGKKKRHTLKSQVGVDLHTGAFCDIGQSAPGPTADITLLKASGLMERLPNGVGGEGDLGFVGIGELHPQGAKYGNTPRRKPRGRDKHRPRGRDNPRPQEDVEYNRAFAQRRVVVEHAICRLRQYGALRQMDRHHRRGHTERVEAVAGLVNRKMQHRLPYLFI
jgi:hypothetical protein